MKNTIEEIHLSKTGKLSDKWSSYLTVYSSLFEIWRDEKVRLLEIGIQNGGSLETWEEYFKFASCLIGCDIEEKCRNLTYDNPNVSVIVGDANLQSTYDRIVAKSPVFDICIDDGSHHSSDIFKSFCSYFPILAPGGIYVIEDTHCLYWPRYGGGILNENSAYNFFKKLIDVINIQFWRNELYLEVFLETFFPDRVIPSFIKDGWIDSVEFHNSMIIIKKAKLASNEKLGSRIATGNEAIVFPAALDLKKLP